MSRRRSFRSSIGAEVEDPIVVLVVAERDPLYHILRYTRGMADAISVRLDEDARRALTVLEASGLSRSEAIRSALVAAAGRLRERSELAAEVAKLEADEADRVEMLAVAELMESLRAPG
jgi:Arc/MetJ-type ribon-helix-helix transcriptional regulator